MAKTVTALERNPLYSFTNSHPINNKNFTVSAGRQDELFQQGVPCHMLQQRGHLRVLQNLHR
jgi:hypothetical protein